MRAIVLIFALLVTVAMLLYAFMPTKPITANGNDDSEESEETKVFDEHIRHSFEQKVKKRPQLLVAERREAIMSDKKWNDGVKRNVGSGKAHSDYQTALTWAALKAAAEQYPGSITNYDVIPILTGGTLGSATGKHKQFKLWVNNDWKVFDAAETWSEYEIFRQQNIQ